MSRVSFAFAAAAATLIALPAAAADLYGQRAPVQTQQPYAAYGEQSPLHNWSGAYLGLNLGYGFGRVKNTIGGTVANADLSGATGGIFAGINQLVTANIIVGAEADLSLSDQRGDWMNGGNLYRNKSSWNGTVRARVGASYDRYMPYLTGGLAFADDTVSGPAGSASETKVGYALGAGLEGAVTDRVSVRLEYMHLGFGSSVQSAGGTAISTSPSHDLIRVGAGYKF